MLPILAFPIFMIPFSSAVIAAMSKLVMIFVNFFPMDSCSQAFKSILVGKVSLIYYEVEMP